MTGEAPCSVMSVRDSKFQGLVTMVLALALSNTEVSSLKARILVAPESINITLNATTTFNCIVTGESINWFVNGHRQNTPELTARGVEVDSPVDPEHGTINSTLTIPATIDNDNITISCRVAGDNGIIRSPEVILRVQGLLDSVLNLDINRVDDYNHILTWDPPFTLDITDVDPDIIAYTVCDNVTTSSCQNTSDNHYVFPTLCDPVEFTVSAWNPVGEGERVNMVHEPPDDVRKSTAITYLESEVSFKSPSEPVVTLILQVDGNCFDMFNTEFRGKCSGVSKFENMMPIVDGTGTATLTFSEHIMADDFYTVTIGVVQEPDTSLRILIMKEANLTTFDVQELDVRSGDRTINATCIFARGSQAQGCFIVIELVSGGPPHSPSMEVEAMRGELANGELEGEASTSFTDLEAGTYNVMIYDEGVNGTFDLNKSLYNELIEIKNLSQTVDQLIPTITSASASPEVSSKLSPTIISGVGAGTFITLVMSVLAVIIITGVYMKVRAKNKAEASNTAVKNDPVYEEIELPVEGSPNLSSVNQIAMQANSAYEGVEMCPPTSRNANQMEPCPAYGVVTGQH